MNNQKRSILVLTGTRAEYGLLKSSMEEIRDHEGLSLSVVATGMHLSPKHGMTVDDIREDGFTVDREVLMQVDGDSGTAMAKSVGVGVMGLTDAFKDLDPDIVLLLGDRDEALAGALAAAHMNIPVAHVHGGDSMYGAVIDDSIRHAITKFAHIHFPASELSAERIRKMGEEEWRITISGAPGLDDILAGEYADPEIIFDKYDLDPNKPSLLVVQHPVTTQSDQARDQMAATLDAVESFDVQVVLIYPNSDAGGDAIISEIESRSDAQSIRTFRSLPRRDYLGIMDTVDVMVGNSSSGIIEAPSFSLPVVDVGPRQEGRERAENTLSVAHDSSDIRDAIAMCLEDPEFQQQVDLCENPYDYTGAGRQIADRLFEVEVDEKLTRKHLAY
ncbi:GDP/UDP-N,N'-diacetylbacillosamine 2-epimerase (hydrolysing) [Halorubrum aquaticum]|uniref:GDP/UDP-N,N'-diacetylbacillosamine 2-epimerase (Hydrolysing) n=1 Tax=Halorubrum aquaticum TaxID=387340 RepID=A0A1I3A5V1_9EURY|nr:UDP-N-acetylglucosamine 2-epimerase [Halorubrum aquaticum]SFH45246.1 GDP/UDP-N,N'-diacetylbacillosamine 2-epimerase (hydrolysing) [Halorubrum aquaticum]